MQRGNEGDFKKSPLAPLFKEGEKVKIMSFEFFIAVRHLTRRRKTGFISLISFISVAGVTVGVAALIIVLSVMSGFSRELKRKIVSVQPHLRIVKTDGLDNAKATMTALKEISSKYFKQPPAENSVVVAKQEIVKEE